MELNNILKNACDSDSNINGHELTSSSRLPHVGNGPWQWPNGLARAGTHQ